MLSSNARGRDLSARNAREAILQLLEESPGLAAQLPQIFVRAWRTARNDTLKVLRLPDSAIPEAPYWNFEQAIADAFKTCREK